MTILGRWIPAALVAGLCVHSSAVATTVVNTCGQMVQGTAILNSGN